MSEHNELLDIRETGFYLGACYVPGDRRVFHLIYQHEQTYSASFFLTRWELESELREPVSLAGIMDLQPVGTYRPDLYDYAREALRTNFFWHVGRHEPYEDPCDEAWFTSLGKARDRAKLLALQWAGCFSHKYVEIRPLPLTQ